MVIVFLRYIAYYNVFYSAFVVTVNVYSIFLVTVFLLTVTRSLITVVFTVTFCLLYFLSECTVIYSEIICSNLLCTLPKSVSKLVNGSCHSHTSIPPHPLLLSDFEGELGRDTCASNLSVSYLLTTPKDYQSLHLTGWCWRAPSLRLRRLQKQSCTGNVSLAVLPGILMAASSPEWFVSCDMQTWIWREWINVLSFQQFYT